MNPSLNLSPGASYILPGKSQEGGSQNIKADQSLAALQIRFVANGLQGQSINIDAFVQVLYLCFPCVGVQDYGNRNHRLHFKDTHS